MGGVKNEKFGGGSMKNSKLTRGGGAFTTNTNWTICIFKGGETRRKGGGDAFEGVDTPMHSITNPRTTFVMNGSTGCVSTL